MYYMVLCNPFLGGSVEARWFGIDPISAGVFGVPAGIALLIVASLLTRAPDARSNGLVDRIRAPE